MSFKKQLLTRVLIVVVIAVAVPVMNKLLFPDVGFQYVVFLVAMVVVMAVTLLLEYIEHRKKEAGK